MLLLLALIGVGNVLAVPVRVTMNNTSRTMTLTNKTTGGNVDVGSPSRNRYEFNADPGTYVLTAYASDATTVNGTIEITVGNTAEEQSFSILTCTAYATNADWTVDNDYTIEVQVNSREGEPQTITLGNSSPAGRKTFLALNGNSYHASLIPNAAHQAEGYMPLHRSGTLTFNVNVSGNIPMGADYSVSVPADAHFEMGMKTSHFVKFTSVQPTGSAVSGDVRTITYRLACGQVYNFRTWKEGGLTQGGYFTMNQDAGKVPVLAFTEADYAAFAPKTVKHDVKWNGGYETGDIFVNINERGHLKMEVGDTYDAHAMRTWQLTDNSTNNYFIEPDFHYTVINPDGTPSTGVIEIENAHTTTDPWTTIKAVGKGTAIVLVTYDAIGLNTYNANGKSPYMGGEYWSAIWPENTAAYVVTVGNEANGIVPNMLINETMNQETKKKAGKNVDAEHDVFYYLDTQEGHTYTFRPEGVSSVEIAYPTIGTNAATYTGFSATGVTHNADGSYSLLLKEGRQIVRLSDASGNAAYQVFTAKRCSREITNATRPGSNVFQRGDQVKIQYNGLQHPANKLAGIYNMSAYVTYNGIPNGSSLILGSGQYTFGSAPSAQGMTVDIPSDFEGNEMLLGEGVIQVNGYGDPIGNHRTIGRLTGRNANFTAIAHKTYFGAIPDIVIPIQDTRHILADIILSPLEASLVLKDAKGNVVEKNANGRYPVTLGTYAYEARQEGYKVLRGTFTVADDAPDEISVSLTMTKAGEGAWDGISKTEPASLEGIYQISNAAELAWLAHNVNSNQVYNSHAVLLNDIELSGHDWTPIGGNYYSRAFQGHFDGRGHTIRGIHINSTATHQAFFGYAYNATVENVTLEGDVSSTSEYVAGAVAQTYQSTLRGITNRVKVNGKENVGGITAYAWNSNTIDRCANEADITATQSNAAGITPYVSDAGTSITNCLNTGTISGASQVATIVGNVGNKATTVRNNLALGKVVCAGTNSGNVYTGTFSGHKNIRDNFVSEHYACGQEYETLTTPQQLASGEIACLLGEAWGQEIGTDAYPRLGGKPVFKGISGYSNKDEDTHTYDLTVLTFEDADFKGDGKKQSSGQPDWSSLIAQNQGSDKMLYGEGGYGSEELFYFWDDSNNTSLHHDFPKTVAGYAYWFGGHAISHYVSGEETTYGDNSSQLTVYKQGVTGMQTAGGGHNGSDNFAVHYGYYQAMGVTPALNFADGEPRVIDHMYVNTTTYLLNTIRNGNSMTQKIGADDWIKIIATGTDSEGKKHTAEFFLCQGPDNVVTEWTKWDLSVLGPVVAVNFDIQGTSNNGYGFSQPAYFAYDDVAVRMPRVITLADKTPYDNQVATQTSALTYTRTFETTLWQPLYVPFNSGYGAWSQDVEIAKISSATDDALYITALQDDEEVKANTPYLIRAKETGDIAIKVENTMLMPAKPGSLICGDLTFTGTYSPVVIQPDTYSVLHNGKIVSSSNASGYQLPPMRWHVTGAKSAEMRVLLGGETTGIEGINAETPSEGRIYNLAGQRLQRMQKGINIINGKKVIK